MSSCKETECFTAEWNIANFSLFSSAGAHPVKSPVFKTETTQGIATWWRMLVYYSESNIKFKLLLYNGGSVNDRYELSLSTTFREVLLPLTEFCASKSKSFVYSIKTDDIFGSNKDSFLPQDTLTICCRIWQIFMKPGNCSFLSVLHRVNLVWEVEEFNFSDYINRSLHQQDTLRLITIIYKDAMKGTHKVRIETCANIEGFPFFVNCKLSVKDGRGHCISSDYIDPSLGWLWDIEVFDNDSERYNLRLELQSLIAVEMKYQSPSFSLTGQNSYWISTGASEEAARSSSSQKEDFLLLYMEGFENRYPSWIWDLENFEDDWNGNICLELKSLVAVDTEHQLMSAKHPLPIP
ncbi:hypothetical protein JTE90_005721 [Oedothorax gibbosus]|uniref:MATH domain-containing protein n=1 Tax=Oedothorax gibbosus TaxID=931172 RepID=A0AAV6ULS9_9ARAC|nr:hypothetical protein JTE90_005721 [Oedothorax gibbosus]